MPMLTKHKFYGVSLAMLLGGALATIYLMAGASTPRPLPQVDPTAQPDVQPLQRLELIEPGTQVTEQGVEGWSHLVLLVMPELTDGAVDSLHPYAHDWASMFMLTIAADVQQAESGQYALKRLGVGFTYKMDDQLRIIRSDNLCGAELGPIDRQVLAGNERCFDDVYSVARTPTMIVFDAVKTQIVIDGQHTERITRHAIRVDRETGQVFSLAWLLKETPEGTYILDRRDLRWMPENLRERRRIHVDDAHVTLGIPTAKAFAMLDLPPGETLLIGEDWEDLAACRTMTTAQVQELEAKLSATVAAATSNE